MFNVSKEVFNKFVIENKLQKIQGENIHSYNYVDNDGNIMAYKETSSYDNNTIYQINDIKFTNFETLNIVNNLLNL